MPPTLALFLTIGFVVFLFRRDFREKPNITGALWLPLLWMLIICSRAVTQWLNIFGVHVGGASLEEGSPVDAFVYYILIAAGIYVLKKRQVQLSEIIRNNQWLTIFFVYCFLAILWSDFPFVSLKRWTKVIGHPIMVLILFTEPDPGEALRRLMKRCAYVVVPVSILLIKYYPTIGRTAGPWATASMNNGIAQGKNLLGADCLIVGFFFFWHLLQTWPTEKGVARRNELLLTVGFLLAICWLLRVAESSTATMTLIVSALTVVLLGRRFVNKRLIGAYVLAGVMILLVAEAAFGMSAILIENLGRDSTLTGRTVLWKQVLEFQGNPIFGVGFESFWLGERLRKIGELYWWQANEAHNGYLETYLNLGLIGLFIMIGWIIATFRKSRLEFLRNFEFGRFRLGFLAAAVVYNWTESAFRTLHPIWFVFFIIALDYPKLEYESVVESSGTTNAEKEMEVAYAGGEA
jgi:exopolysaccharide production protein ExoQ